jgi:hypothetical protein
MQPCCVTCLRLEWKCAEIQLIIMKFIFKFCGCFFLLSMMCYLIFDRTNEMMGYIIWFMGSIALTSPVLLAPKIYIKDNSPYLAVIKLCLSLLLFNILIYLMYRKNLFFILIDLNYKRSEFLLSIMLYAIFIGSYLVSSLTWRTNVRAYFEKIERRNRV